MRVAVIGTGGRGRQLMDHVPAEGRIVAICDCYRQRCLETLAQKKKEWKTYQYYKEMFEKEKSIDAVVIGFKTTQEIDEAIERIDRALVDA